MPLDATNQVIQRLVFQRKQLVDYAIIHQTLSILGNWVDVVKIDCCHGEAHLHRYAERGTHESPRRVLRVLRSRQDVADTYDEAVELVMDNYEEHLGGWSRGQ